MFFLRFLLIFHQKEFYSNRSSVSAGKKNSFQALSPFLCKRRIKWNERTKETLTHAYTHLTMQTPSRRWSKPFTDLFIWHTLSFIFQFNLKLIRRLGCCLFSAKKEEIILYIYIFIVACSAASFCMHWSIECCCSPHVSSFNIRLFVRSKKTRTVIHSDTQTQTHADTFLCRSPFVCICTRTDRYMCVCISLYLYNFTSQTWN